MSCTAAMGGPAVENRPSKAALGGRGSSSKTARHASNAAVPPDA